MYAEKIENLSQGEEEEWSLGLTMGRRWEKLQEEVFQTIRSDSAEDFLKASWYAVSQ